MDTTLTLAQACQVAGESATMATQIEAEATAALGSDLPTPVRDAISDYKAATQELRSLAELTARDRDELIRRKDLVPPQGWRRLKAEADAETSSLANEADARAKEALGLLREHVEDAAVARPPSNPQEVMLLRQELDVALSGATGHDALARITDIIASNPSLAGIALRTSYVRTALAARGLDPREIDNGLKAARRLVALAKAEHDQQYSRLLKVADGLGSSRSLSVSAVNDVLASRA